MSKQTAALAALTSAFIPSMSSFNGSPSKHSPEHLQKPKSGKSFNPDSAANRRYWNFDLTSMDDSPFLEILENTIETKLDFFERLQVNVLLIMLSYTLGSFLIFGRWNLFFAWKPFTK